MIRNVSSIILVFYISFFSIALAESNEAANIDISYSYGAIKLLPSLIRNSNLVFDSDEHYSDIWIEGGFTISDRLSFEGALELTDQPHQLIGTKFSRPDYPLSTGRFQKSVVSYASNDLTVSVGRDDMLSGPLRPNIFSYPSFGDGFSWRYNWKGWSFKHVFQVLPAEQANNQIFRRSISYHHLAKTLHSFTVGVGEYFILTGEHIGLDLKRLNPFLPYSLNSHDSVADYYPGFVGDSDNSLIKLFLNWSNHSSQLAVGLYVDEFQIDAVDREVYNDAMLLSFSAKHEIEWFGALNQISWGFSASNPNFGQHPGPFTTTTFAAYPLFEYTPGMKSLAYFDAQVPMGKGFQLFMGSYT
ncbi:MAG: hypothetical protein K9M55_12200, partial [Candidatus Marinimicrobia bacterium]|nr:hypothetical protein [Candidatus Neomarinimicrobiota bacterium]